MRSKTRQKNKALDLRNQKIANLNLEIGKKVYLVEVKDLHVSDLKANITEYAVIEGNNTDTHLALRAEKNSLIYTKELRFGHKWYDEDAWYCNLYLTYEEAVEVVNKNIEIWKERVSTPEKLLNLLFEGWKGSFGDYDVDPSEEKIIIEAMDKHFSQYRNQKKEQE